MAPKCWCRRRQSLAKPHRAISPSPTSPSRHSLFPTPPASPFPFPTNPSPETPPSPPDGRPGGADCEDAIACKARTKSALISAVASHPTHPETPPPTAPADPGAASHKPPRPLSKPQLFGKRVANASHTWSLSHAPNRSASVCLLGTREASPRIDPLQALAGNPRLSSRRKRRRGSKFKILHASETRRRASPWHTQNEDAASTTIARNALSGVGLPTDTHAHHPLHGSLSLARKAFFCSPVSFT